MVRFVDRGGVVIILDGLDVWMNVLEVEVPGVARLYSFSPLEVCVGVVVGLSIFSICVSSLMDK